VVATWARRAVAAGATTLQALGSAAKVGGLRAVAEGLADAARHRVGPRRGRLSR